MKAFRQFLVPESTEEAIGLKRSIGARSLYIAGGTTVVPFASRGVDVLIDISGLGLDGIRFRGGSCSIGATTKISALVSSDVFSGFPALYEAARSCATPAVRNMATLGGSLAGIYLPSDVGVALLTLGARIKLEGETSRTVAMEELLSQGWLSGYDLITEVVVDRPPPSTAASFVKFGRSDVDIALVSAATCLTVSDRGRIGELRICVGQTSAKPVLLNSAASVGIGREPSLRLIESIADSAASVFEAKSDSRASSDYRRHLVRVLVGRSLVASSEGVGARLEG